MSIWVSGDTHGDFTRFSTDNFPQGKNLTKEDYVVILGDCGLIWSQQEDNREKYWKLTEYLKTYKKVWVPGFPTVLISNKTAFTYMAEYDSERCTS